MNKTINTIIFDCDGTLVDSELICNQGISLKLSEYGVNLDANQLIEKYRGAKLSEILKSIEVEYKISLSDTFVTEYRTLIEELFEKELKPIEGAQKLLSELVKLNLKVCVASNGPLEKIKKSLTCTGLIEYFDEKLYSSYEINSWKPDPDLFLYAAKSMQTEPNKCLVIEDSRLGIMAANRAGMKACLFDSSKKVILESEYKYHHVGNLLDVLEIIC